jgi:hypothetical protein
VSHWGVNADRRVPKASLAVRIAESKIANRGVATMNILDSVAIRLPCRSCGNSYEVGFIGGQGDWAGLRFGTSGSWDDTKKQASIKDGSLKMHFFSRIHQSCQ